MTQPILRKFSQQREAIRQRLNLDQDYVPWCCFNKPAYGEFSYQEHWPDGTVLSILDSVWRSFRP